jgi:predicted kinase
MALPANQRMILIAGPVRSGKSTLAKHVVERFGGIRVGFGDAVRQRTRMLGLPDERSFWQQVGEEWVTSDAEGLCDATLAPAAEETLVVVDGLRHRSVYDLLRARAGGRRVVLVFVDADVSVRRDRLAADRISVSDAAIGQVLTHSTEAELPWLRGRADIVTDGTRDASLVLDALAALIADGGSKNSR